MSISICPVCGTPVRQIGTDEGTQHYDPATVDEVNLRLRSEVSRLRWTIHDMGQLVRLAWDTPSAHDQSRYLRAAMLIHDEEMVRTVVPEPMMRVELWQL